ncbi:MAG: nucleotidyltransferase domain-containing protein [Desulfococcaceae bacterium]
MLAEKAAGFLREKYGAHRVPLLGSLARGEVFDHRSDVDLAVFGLSEENTTARPPI